MQYRGNNNATLVAINIVLNSNSSNASNLELFSESYFTKR